MSATHGCNDVKEVVESFKEALIGRVGADRYRMWFSHGVEFNFAAQDFDELIEASVAADSNGDAAVDASDKREPRGKLIVRVRGQFALDRVRNNFLRELRGAAMQACGGLIDVQLCLAEPAAEQAELPLHDSSSDVDSNAECVAASSCVQASACSVESSKHRPRPSASGRGKAKSLSHLIADGAGTLRDAKRRGSGGSSVAQLELIDLDSEDAIDSASVVDFSEPAPLESAASPASASPASASPASAGTASAGTVSATATPRSAMTAASFVQGACNRLAHTAMVMACQNPGSASPLFLCGPTGTGKTHLMAAIADQLRRRHRMRCVMHLSAEQFTNDFIRSVGNSGITAFRRRYREVDALLIDDVQFLGSKKATLREMLYTVETLSEAGRPLIFSGLQSPTEIEGLSSELAGRMAAGLVCPVQSLDAATREVVFRRGIQQRCPFPLPDAMVEQINSTLAGDGRVISGVVNLINTLERMYGRVPTMDELRRFGGELLRAAKPVATLSVIESAVCEAFHLPADTLRGGSQTRAITGPRMLAMYLARQFTSSAYVEIAKHFGGKSHSTAIAAEHNIRDWLETGKSIGRGHSAMSTQEAIDRVESILRTG